MLSVLTLSTLFPSTRRRIFGQFVANQTLALAARPGVRVRVVAPIGLPPFARWIGHYRSMTSQPLSDTWEGLNVERPRFRHWPGQSARDPAAMTRALLPRLRALRHDFPFDVIDAEFFFPDGPAAVALGAALGCPVSIKARGSDVHFWGAQPGIASMLSDAGQCADGLLAVSDALRRDMVALGMPGERIMVHYTGLDHARFCLRDRAAIRQGLGIAGPLIVCVGTLNANKGQALVIEALTCLPQASLAIIGDGPDRQSLHALAEQFGVAGRVRFTGPCPPDAIANWLNAADVMALPSAREGIANIWIEALACGTPLVITDAGGAREIVQSAAAGRIVARTPEAIAAACAELIASPPKRGEVAACAAGFSWERNAEALEAHLRRLVSAYHNPRAVAAQ